MTRALFSAAVCRRSARDGFRLSRGPRCGGASAVPARAGSAAAGSASAAPPGGARAGLDGSSDPSATAAAAAGGRRRAQTGRRTEATPRDVLSAARGGGGGSPRGGACGAGDLTLRPPRATGCAPGQDARASSAVEEARPPSASSAGSTPGRGDRAARVSRAPASPSTGVGCAARACARQATTSIFSRSSPHPPAASSRRKRSRGPTARYRAASGSRSASSLRSSWCRSPAVESSPHATESAVILVCVASGTQTGRFGRGRGARGGVQGEGGGGGGLTGASSSHELERSGVGCWVGVAPAPFYWYTAGHDTAYG